MNIRALASAATAVALSSTAVAAPTKIMFIGDSITNGGQTYASYRYPLYFDLTDAGYSLDVVGSSTTLYNGSTPNSTLYPKYNTTFDRNHEGYWGITTTNFLSQKSTVAANYAPEVVTIFLGSNDVNENVSNASNNYKTSTDNIGLIIDKLRAKNPNVKIAIAQIIPATSTASYGFASANAKMPGYNAAVAAFAATKTTASSPIVVVDQYTNYNPVALNQTSDGVHPNQYGEQLIADRFYRALQPLLSPGQAVKSADIHLGNTSFEGANLSDTGVATLPAGQGWTFKNTANADGGIFNPGAATYTGAAGNGTPSGALGSSAAYVYNINTATPETRMTISQQLGAFIMESMEYTLTVAIGNRLATNTYGTTYGGYSVELLAGGTVIGSQSDLIIPAEGTFADISFTIDSNALDPSFLGKELSIVLSQTSLVAHASTDFDNVRLTATSNAVPEPGTATLGLLGIAVLAFVSARKRQRAA